MGNFKLEHGSMEMWLVCEAIGKNRELIDKMQKNEDGTYPVVFSVGGVELNFSLVANRIDEHLNELVANKAIELLDERYEDLLGEIMDIQERIKGQKERFKYDWENTNCSLTRKDMKKPLAVAVRIYQGDTSSMADIRTSPYDGSKLETIVWTNVEERNRFEYNGYTLFYDTRTEKSFLEV